jgi:Mn2+/Fe2+ NRAMP family transporter
MKHPLKAIYCNQYYELKPKGKEDLVKEYGTALSTVAVMLVLFAIYMTAISLFPDVEKVSRDIIKDIFGLQTGKSAGKILGLFLVFVSWPIVRFTVGTEQSYQSIIAEFDQLDAEEQQKVSKFGLWSFIGAVIIFGIGFLIFFLFN